MNRHVDAGLVENGRNLVEEVVEVALQLTCVHAGVFGKFAAQPLRRRIVGGAGEACEKSLRETPLLRGRGLGPELRSACARGGVVVSLKPLALQHEHLERTHLVRVVAERHGPVRQNEVQIGTRPVVDRHEVVAHRLDATRREVAEVELVVLDVAVEVTRALLHVLVYGNGLDHAPRHSGLANFVRTRLDFARRPHVARLVVVQRRHHVRHARLPDFPKRNRIRGSKPSPSCFHSFTLLLFPRHVLYQNFPSLCRLH